MAWEILPGRSLRGRLIISYVVVVAVALIAVVSALSVLLPTYRSRQADARLTELARPTLRLVVELGVRGAPADEIRSELAEQAEATGLRILLVGRNGLVVSDSQVDGTLQGRPFIAAPQPGPLRPAAVQRGQFVDGGVYHYVAVPVATPRGRSDAAFLVLAQSEATWADVWGELGWRLAVAGLVAAVAATIMATLMTRSLYRPIANLRRATQAMARGHYDQQVPVEGPAELAGLARAFNDMSGQLRASRASMQEFVANVSHELRTPLTSIRGFVEALSDGTVDDEPGRRRSLAVIDAELRRLQRLVASLLDLSRIESGQAALRRDRVDLAPVVAQCAEVVSARAADAGVALVVEAPAGVAMVVGDADRLEQVVANLLDNALRYTPAGGRIGLRLSTDGASARVAVADTGPGVAPASQPHLFERFYTADPARAGAGAGLGLAIAREIALAHGGDIEVDSRLGEGTVFTLVLPLAEPLAIRARGRHHAHVS